MPAGRWSTIGTVDETGLAEFQAHRPRLMGLAYRMLGELSEAEDVVQDAYLRWRANPRATTPAAWLTTVVTNLCLNRLASARARRERYVGTWLPEPLLTDNRSDPQVLIERQGDLSLGFLAVLERLTPPERAAFVLRSAFGHSHRDIAAVLGTDEAHARQLYHRARARIGDPRRRFVASPEQNTELVQRFLAAALDGDLAGLEKVLSDEVTVWSDGGGKVTASPHPISGRFEVARYLVGLASSGRAATVTFTAVEVNGDPGIVVQDKGALIVVLVPEIHDGQIHAVRAVLNPTKLRFITAQLDGRVHG